MEKYYENRKILCIDLKSFYASVECALYNLDPFKTPLVVADQKRGPGSIVLAVSPYLKNLGLKSRQRIYELPSGIDYVFARPRMQKYIEYATKVINIYLKFVSEDDLFVYSIDETFLDVTNYLNYYQMTEEALATKILKTLEEELKLFAACGIGPNMLIAKLALDLEAKSNNNFIAKWSYQDISKKLWPVEPLSKMWGIGSRMERNLNLLGIYKIGDIAKYSKETLKRKFGILGLELYYHSHGIDLSKVKDKIKLEKVVKSFSVGQVLFKDYYFNEFQTIILEMTDDLVRRLRLAKMKAKTIKLAITYSNNIGGFQRQTTIDLPTNNQTTIYSELLNIFNFYYENYPIRKVSISLSNLSTNNVSIYNMFENIDNIEKEYRLYETIDQLKLKYGKNIIGRAISEADYATAKKRNEEIGGHHV